MGKQIYIDSCRYDYGFMKATTCLQTHEDTLRGNSIKVIEHAPVAALIGEVIRYHEDNDCGDDWPLLEKLRAFKLDAD